jgi:hypothetical protein
LLEFKKNFHSFLKLQLIIQSSHQREIFSGHVVQAPRTAFQDRREIIAGKSVVRFILRWKFLNKTSNLNFTLLSCLGNRAKSLFYFSQMKYVVEKLVSLANLFTCHIWNMREVFLVSRKMKKNYCWFSRFRTFYG